MKAGKFNVSVQNRIDSAIIQTFNKDCIITKVIAQSSKKQKGNFKPNDVVSKELKHSEGCTCYARGTVGARNKNGLECARKNKCVLSSGANIKRLQRVFMHVCRRIV